MADTVVENLILDLLEWLAKGERSYEEVDGGVAHVMPQTPGVGRTPMIVVLS